MEMLRELQVHHSPFFSSPVEPIQVVGVDHIHFPSFLMISHAGAILNHSLLAIQLFWSAQDIFEDSCFHSTFVQALSRLVSHSSHLIQPVQHLF